MANEDTNIIAGEPELSSSLTFSEEELSALEDDFKAPADDDEEEDDAEDDSEDADEEEEEAGEEEEGEDDKVSDEDAEGGTDAAEAGKDGEGEQASEEDRDEESEEGYELLVDGRTVFVDTEDELAAWAQKGLHYERKRLEMERSVENATFTMNAMVNDPMAALEEIWTGKFQGNHEQARSHIQKLCEAYLEPIWRELTAEPAQRMKLQQDRFTAQSQKMQAQHNQATEGQFTQEDIDFIQNLDTQIESALTGVGLPAEDSTLRKWMADVMRDGLGRGIHPDPVMAAQFIKSQQQERDQALGNSAPAKDRKKTKGSKKAAKIAKAKARRSQRQGGDKSAPHGRRRKAPQFMSSREWLDSLNKDLQLEP